ncbi:hypothetical protein [Corynebacterium variabile]|uniref:hypothetical protein n=1 Tax=Corynebacterium variabile TaxID=1727 RepID=UPI00289872FF|nr:hypothetical protein [Corynebacterium variabile]
MHTKSTTRHQPRHQVGHARREYDAAPGHATADLADNPIARGILLALVVALIITGGGAIVWQVAQHSAVATLTAGIILTAIAWRWAR